MWTPTEPLIQAVERACNRHALFPWPHAGPRRPVVVAVSGGRDSVALLLLLSALAPAHHLTLHVAHLDHGLRAGSAGDSHFVARLARQRQLPFHSHRLAPGELSAHENREAAARSARYAFLCRVADAVTPAGMEPTVATGHHADDQAETVLMHLLRGSGPAGLSAMAWVTRLTGPEARPVRLVRPLLGVTREQIQRYLEAEKVTWREDETNQDRRRIRNRLRHEIIPQLLEINPNLVETLGRTAQILAGDQERLTALDRANWDRVVVSHDGDRMVLDLQKLAGLSAAEGRGVLRLAAAALQPAGPPPLSFEQLDDLLHRLRQPAAGGPHPLGQELAWTVYTVDGEPRCSIHRHGASPCSWDTPLLDGTEPLALGAAESLHVGEWTLTLRRSPVSDLPVCWQENRDPWQAFLDGDRARDLRLQRPAAGMTMAPLGMAGRRRALGDIFTDLKIPEFVRSAWPVLVHGEEGRVLWLCGLRVGHEARITPATREVIWLRWQRVAAP